MATGAVLLMASLLVSVTTSGSQAATNNPAGGTVQVYSPITDCDSDHGDYSSWWSQYNPATHHRIYKYATSAGSYYADVSLDVYARAAGKCIVTPFGTRTAAGDGVATYVESVRAGCASKVVADGGYVVFLKAVNTRTGKVIGRGSVMHVSGPAVKAGQRLGPWTVIGRTAQFRNTSCYQVSGPAGIHTHIEWVNYDRYACYRRFSYGASLKETTSIGMIGTNKTAARAVC